MMLNASIVLYKTVFGDVKNLVATLHACKSVGQISLIDNSPTRDERFAALPVKYLFNGKNISYGAAHNIAIRQTIAQGTPYHLVVNPDIILTADALTTMVEFMAAHREVGQLMPHVVYPDGKTQYLCKLLPTPLDVFGRRFLPKRWTARRNARYELRASGYDKMMNVPYLSGCFMLLRTEAVLKAQLFDERFFMYPEDIDLTRRIHRDYLTVYFPYATIVHNHAQASYHSLKMLWIHMREMAKYFNKWGWFVDRERKMINQQVLNNIGKLE